jgi:nucleotide-binding universal stress UspA family protein
MVCMTSHGRGRFRWAAIGSVTMGVLNSARCPVLVTRPGAK